MKKQILVTGGTGYIGSHTVVELQQVGYEVVIIDNLSNSNKEVLTGIFKITGVQPIFHEIDCLDISKIEAIFKQYQFEGVIHFAASKAVGESVDKPVLYYRNNLVSLLNVLELMSKYAVKNLVFSSSCTVYGQPDLLPVTEESPIKVPLSPYGNTKQICEEMIRDTVQASSNFNSIVLRYFNPVGAHPSAHIGELPIGIPQNLIPFVTQTAAKIRSQLSVYGNDYDTPDGSCIRDYINVVDLAKAHVVALRRMIEQKSAERIETFNLGTGIGLSVLQIINLFEQVNQVKVNYKIVGRRVGDIEQVWADPAKSNNVLGWKAHETVEDTLKSAWKWQLKLLNL